MDMAKPLTMLKIIMKKQSLALILYLVYNFAYGQTTFTLLISNPTNEIPGGIVELSDQSFVLSSAFYTDQTDRLGQRFFKINNTGIVTHDSIIENPNGAACLWFLVYTSDTNIFCIGDWNNLNEKDQKWVMHIDTGLNIQWEKKHQTNYDYFKTTDAFRNSQNNIITSAVASDSIDPSRDFLFFQEYSMTGDLIKSSVDSSAHNAISYDMIEFPGDNMYRAAVAFYNPYYSSGQILMIDSSLTVIGVDSIPYWVSLYNSMKKINDSCYYISGNTHIYGGYDYALMRLDQNNDCKKVSILGQQDTIDYAGIVKSMDFIDQNLIYVGATSNIDLFYGRFSQQKSWYALSSFDSLLNLRWTKYYGGNACYFLQSVTATKDGGALLAGTRFDYTVQNDCDIYLIKVDENGVLTNDDHIQTQTVHDAIVFPNPGSNYVTIESGPQISGSEFRMNNIEGKQMISTTLTERRTTLETQFLPSGIYVWQIIFQERLVESGKWIKE